MTPESRDSLPRIGRTSKIEELISVNSLDDLDPGWITSEIRGLEEFGSTSSTSINQLNKPALVEKLENFKKTALGTSRLLRVLFRLAKANNDSKQLCEELVSTILSNKNGTVESGSQSSYAMAVKTQEPQLLPSAITPAIEKQNSRITLIPKNGFEADIKKLRHSLKNQPINSSRKSKAGNIVLECENDEDIQKIESTLQTENFVEIKKMVKNLPKLTVLDVGEIENGEDMKTSILSKNVAIKNLVDQNKHFEILFVKKWNDSTNIVLKVDPEIRLAILTNKSRLYVGLKSCHVIDSFPYKVCYNCQKTCSHLSTNCPTRDKKICRYCSGNHESKNCTLKNDTTKHICVNCAESNIGKIKNDCKSHFSNSKECPLIQSIIRNIKETTCYSVGEKN